jgi:hypothetical protein
MDIGHDWHKVVYVILMQYYACPRLKPVSLMVLYAVLNFPRTRTEGKKGYWFSLLVSLPL